MKRYGSINVNTSIPVISVFYIVLMFCNVFKISGRMHDSLYFVCDEKLLDSFRNIMYVLFFCAVLCCAVLCCAVLCCDVLCCAVLCCAVLCCAALRCPALHCTVLYCIALLCSVLFCSVYNWWKLPQWRCPGCLMLYKDSCELL